MPRFDPNWGLVTDDLEKAGAAAGYIRDGALATVPLLGGLATGLYGGLMRDRGTFGEGFAQGFDRFPLASESAAVMGMREQGLEDAGMHPWAAFGLDAITPGGPWDLAAIKMMHATPHRFDRFEFSPRTFESGEGTSLAHSHSRGGYFSHPESPGVHESYFRMAQRRASEENETRADSVLFDHDRMEAVSQSELLSDAAREKLVETEKILNQQNAEGVFDSLGFSFGPSDFYDWIDNELQVLQDVWENPNPRDIDALQELKRYFEANEATFGLEPNFIQLDGEPFAVGASRVESRLDPWEVRDLHGRLIDANGDVDAAIATTRRPWDNVGAEDRERITRHVEFLEQYRDRITTNAAFEPRSLEVDIDVEPEELLVENLPFEQQTPHVQERLAEIAQAPGLDHRGIPNRASGRLGLRREAEEAMRPYGGTEADLVQWTGTLTDYELAKVLDEILPRPDESWYELAKKSGAWDRRMMRDLIHGRARLVGDPFEILDAAPTPSGVNLTGMRGRDIVKEFGEEDLAKHGIYGLRFPDHYQKQRGSRLGVGGQVARGDIEREVLDQWNKYVQGYEPSSPGGTRRLPMEPEAARKTRLKELREGREGWEAQLEDAREQADAKIAEQRARGDQADEGEISQWETIKRNTEKEIEQKLLEFKAKIEILEGWEGMSPEQIETYNVVMWPGSEHLISDPRPGPLARPKPRGGLSSE